MYSMENLLYQDYRPNGTSAFRFPYRLQGDREMGFFRESLPFERKSKVAIVNDKGEDVDSEDEIVKEKEKAKLKMIEDKEDEEDQEGRDRILSETFVAVIAQSILSVPTKRMTLSSIYNYIANNYPHFDKEKGPGWRNSVRHNLSSNDCFVKASRAENGKGHYWMIHPKDLPEFSKGNFRRPRKPRRPRCTHGIGCLSERTIFPSAIGGSYYMSAYSASKHPDYDYSLPMLATSPADVFSRGYGLPSRYDTLQRDDGFGISSYHGHSSSSSPTYLGFPWPDSTMLRNYAAISHSYYPCVIMPPTVSELSVLQQESSPKSKKD